jgi:N-acetylglucosaminyldiphosphoundecaprenol N-acetyl-beta-D-mannosaminyltransferase
MISAGLEWLWRLIIEPRRLASRYLLGNPAFLYRLGKQVVSVRRGSAK